MHSTNEDLMPNIIPQTSSQIPTRTESSMSSQIATQTIPIISQSSQAQTSSITTVSQAFQAQTRPITQPLQVQTGSITTGYQALQTQRPTASSTVSTPLIRIQEDSNDSYMLEDNYPISADQFRQDPLKLLRNRYYINESDTLSFHMENEEYYLDYLMNWGLSARIEDILRKPIIVIEE